MSETTPETSELRERMIEAVSARLHVTTDRITGLTHGIALSADTAAVREAVDALLPVVAQEIAAAEQRGRDDKTTRITHVEFAQMIADAEQRGREEVRARIEAIAREDDAFGDLVCQIATTLRGGPAAYIDGRVVAIERCYASGNAQRVTRLVQDRLRAALAEPAAEEGK